MNLGLNNTKPKVLNPPPEIVKAFQGEDEEILLDFSPFDAEDDILVLKL